MMTTFLELITSFISDLRYGGFIKGADELKSLADFSLYQNSLINIRKDALKK